MKKSKFHANYIYTYILTYDVKDNLKCQLNHNFILSFEIIVKSCVLAELCYTNGSSSHSVTSPLFTETNIYGSL